MKVARLFRLNLDWSRKHVFAKSASGAVDYGQFLTLMITYKLKESIGVYLNECSSNSQYCPNRRSEGAHNHLFLFV